MGSLLLVISHSSLARLCSTRAPIRLFLKRAFNRPTAVAESGMSIRSGSCSVLTTLWCQKTQRDLFVQQIRLLLLSQFPTVATEKIKFLEGMQNGTLLRMVFTVSNSQDYLMILQCNTDTYNIKLMPNDCRKSHFHTQNTLNEQHTSPLSTHSSQLLIFSVLPERMTNALDSATRLSSARYVRHLRAVLQDGSNVFARTAGNSMYNRVGKGRHTLD